MGAALFVVGSGAMGGGARFTSVNRGAWHRAGPPCNRNNKSYAPVLCVHSFPHPHKDP